MRSGQTVQRARTVRAWRIAGMWVANGYPRLHTVRTIEQNAAPLRAASLPIALPGKPADGQTTVSRATSGMSADRSHFVVRSRDARVSCAQLSAARQRLRTARLRLTRNVRVSDSIDRTDLTSWARSSVSYGHALR